MNILNKRILIIHIILFALCISTNALAAEQASDRSYKNRSSVPEEGYGNNGFDNRTPANTDPVTDRKNNYDYEQFQYNKNHNIKQYNKKRKQKNRQYRNFENYPRFGQ